MIIKGKKSASKQSSSNKEDAKKSNVIKKENAIFDVENAKNSTSNKNDIKNLEIKKSNSNQNNKESFEKIDITSIEFKERIERRRGDRRRGYRRIDERSLVSRAQQEAQSIKELAAREGYKTGLEKASQEIEEIKSSLLEFLSLKDEMYKEFYPHVMEISLEIAQKIIKKEVEASDEVLKNIVMATLDEVSVDTQKIIIKVNSSDLDFAQASLPETIESKGLSAKISFASDDTIEKGSCMIVANNGVIDANFKTQLAVLQSAFGIYKGGI